MGYGGATWATAGTLTLGANTFDVADSTEDGPVVYDQAWWKFTPAALTRITLTAAENGFLRVYTGDEADPVEIVATSGDPAAGTFDAHPGVEYHVLLGRGSLDDPKVTYVLTWTEVALAASPWIELTEDDPATNHLIVTDGDRRLDNPNPDYAGSVFSRPDWMNDVIRGGQAREGDYRAQEEIDLDPPILGATGCVTAHAYAGDRDAITWDSTLCPTVPVDTTAATESQQTSTVWSLEHAPSVGLVSGHIYGLASGPSYGLWYLPVRDNLPPWGALDITAPNPVDYGYPADAVVEWEDDAPDLLSVELADGDPATSSDYPNAWVLNSSRGPVWGSGFTTEWLVGAVDEVHAGTDDQPFMTFSYDDGDVSWNPVPGTDEGWREAWTEEYGTFAPTADSVVVAWPGDLPSGFGAWDRLARIAVKFVLRARRFRFVYEGVPVTAVVRQFPRDDGRGISSAPRLYPPTKAGRLAGGYQ